MMMVRTADRVVDARVSRWINRLQPFVAAMATFDTIMIVWIVNHWS